ncbi:twin-arginine translocase subunit TatC [Halosolutus amylolyticus]|uniref:Sec-independent protein translocase protein TatC n=1 Tax=Halosolutus amylolyticus TaxID=2932267 RepID=A0ABD5PJE3_9EURY|nr:twin-arginine translocase subunit TatC [Halosolutus amylolyticus]
MPDESDERADGDGSDEPQVAPADRSSEPAERDDESDTDSFFGDDVDSVFDDADDADPDEGDPSSTADDGTDESIFSDDADDSADAPEASTADDDAIDDESADERTADNDTASSADDESIEARTDGEGVVGDHPEPGSGGPGYPDDTDVGGISTPPDDEEMPLADHIEEMVLRLAVVFLVGAAGTAIGLLWASQAIEHIWLNVFPYATEEVPSPHVYHPLELWLTRIKLSALLGIMVALPAFIYECYLFMRPGLYPHERKYYLAAVPTSVVLAGLGMLFSYLLVLPILFQYFTYYAEGSAGIAYALGETFNLIITLTGFLAIVFQIPLFIMLAIMMGVTTRRWLAQKRLYFWAAFAGLAFMFAFDPTGMAPILVAITMILLFEGTLLVLKWVGRE